MFYDAERKKLHISVAEAVSAAYIRYASPYSSDVPTEELCIAGTDVDIFSLVKECKKEDGLFARDFVLGDVACEMHGFAYPQYEDGTLTALTFRAKTSADPDALSEDAMRMLRGVAFATAALTEYGGALLLRYEIQSIPFDKTVTKTETPTRAALKRFWERICAALLRDSSHEMERVVKRLPTFLSVAFPYRDVRDGQKDMMRSVYAAARHGETLFAVAPTGTGKTMATLFPALRALGARYADKIFYLTPKNTTASAALEAAEQLYAHGARIRAVHLGSKERLCRNHRENQGCYGCPRSHGKRRADEALALLLSEEKAACGEKDILRVAATYDVCPHELGLAYSMYADLVVGDYNYLFDTKAYLRRYFDRGGNFLFLIDEAHNLPDRAREMYSAELNNETLESLCALFALSARLSEVAKRLSDAFLKTVDALLHNELRADENGTVTGFVSTSVLPVPFLTALGKCLRIFLPEVRPRGGQEDEHTRLLRKQVYELQSVLDKADQYDEHFVTYAIREGEKRSLHFFCIDPSALIGERLDKGKAAVFFSATLSPADYYRSVLCGNRSAVKIEVPSPFDVGSVCVGVVDSVSVRAAAREESLPEVAKLIISAIRPRKGNYMVFCPSFDYLERVADAFRKLTPKTPIAVQKRNMSAEERRAFLNSFSAEGHGYFVGFCVTGGIYAEGIDLVGDRLIGAVIIGMGLPQVSAEREVISSYYQDTCEEGKEYAYFYPALNRILQAAGRVIRTENDRGVIVLIDDRFRDPICRKMFPSTWKHLKYIRDRAKLTEHVAKFWDGVDHEQRQNNANSNK